MKMMAPAAQYSADSHPRGPFYSVGFKRGGSRIPWPRSEGAIYFRVCNCLRRKLAEKGARVEPPRCFKCFKMNFPEFAQLLAEEGHIVSNKSNK